MYPDQVSFSKASYEKSLEVHSGTWCYLALKIELQLVLLPPEAQTETKRRTVEHPSSRCGVEGQRGPLEPHLPFTVRKLKQ